MLGAILLTSRYQIPVGTDIDHEGSMAHIEDHDSNHKNRADVLDTYARIAQFNADFTELDMCRELETLGYSALPKTTMDENIFRQLCGVADTENTFVRTAVILTSAPVIDLAVTNLSEVAPTKDLKQQLKIWGLS